MSKELKIYPISQEALKQASFALIKTEKGDMLFELFANDAPQNVINFVTLANDGFYNGLKFHRVIPNFVAQGGCPMGNGCGGPGYAIQCETKNNPHKHIKGALSMAHAGKDTGGSQFFICFAPQPHLDGEHTVFGQMIEGFDILDHLALGDTILGIEIFEQKP